MEERRTLVQIGNDDFGSFLSEEEGGGTSDSLGCSGDDGYLTVIIQKEISTRERVIESKFFAPSEDSFGRGSKVT